jgi:hypothetical protein
MTVLDGNFFEKGNHTEEKSAKSENRLSKGGHEASSAFQAKEILEFKNADGFLLTLLKLYNSIQN